MLGTDFNIAFAWMSVRGWKFVKLENYLGLLQQGAMGCSSCEKSNTKADFYSGLKNSYDYE